MELAVPFASICVECSSNSPVIAGLVSVSNTRAGSPTTLKGFQDAEILQLLDPYLALKNESIAAFNASAPSLLSPLANACIAFLSLSSTLSTLPCSVQSFFKKDSSIPVIVDTSALTPR